MILFIKYDKHLHEIFITVKWIRERPKLTIVKIFLPYFCNK